MGLHTTLHSNFPNYTTIILYIPSLSLSLPIIPLLPTLLSLKKSSIEREIKRGEVFLPFKIEGERERERERESDREEEKERKKIIIYLCIIKKGRHFNQSAMKSVFPFLSVAGVEMESR
jgi:hypothetical protein